MDKEPGPVTAFLRSLPPWAETVFVVAVAFGIFIATSLDVALEPPQTPIESSAEDFLVLMAIELMQGLILLWFLRAREWTPEKLGVAPIELRDFLHPILLLVTVILVSWGAYYLATAIRPDLAINNVGLDEEGVPAAIAISFSLVNAAYEEIFVCAYIVAAWRGTDTWTAIAISSVIRLAYHLYQGPLAIAMIFPMGVLMAWYFASQRRVLPLILTHAVLDIIAFWQNGA